LRQPNTIATAEALSFGTIIFKTQIQIKMKTLSLDNYGVSELSHSEQRETDRGNPWLIAAAVATVVYCANECSKEIQKRWGLYEPSPKKVITK
jgi:hypothetical protein